MTTKTQKRELKESGAKETREALVAAAAAGTLTKEQLSAAICTVDNGGFESIPHSVGTAWVRANHEQFVAAVGDVHAFLREHLDVPFYFVGNVLGNARMLMEIPEVNRVAFIRDALVACRNYVGTYWWKAAIEAGVRREHVCDLFIGHLANVVVERGLVNDVDDFMRYGNGHSGDIEPGSVWEMLGGRLESAVWFCVEKSPKMVLQERAKLARCIPDDFLQPILIAAANRLETVVCREVLQTLPLVTRLALARRIKEVDIYQQAETARFLVALCLEEGQEFCDEVALPLFEKSNAATLYRSTWSMIAKVEDAGGQKCDWLKRRLEQRLEAAGYVIGVITEGTYFDRRSGRDLPQKKVLHDGRTYVQDRRQHRYFPRVGDVVLFSIAQGRPLTRHTTAVIFQPAHRDGEV